MPRVLVPVFVVCALLVAAFSVAPRPSTARDNGTPAASPTAGTPVPVCSPEELAEGEAVEFLPPGETEAVTNLHGWDGDEMLYLGVLTLPPGSCIDFRYRAGAAILFVEAGSVVYTSRVAADADVVITKGNSDGDDTNNQDVTPGATVSLHTDEWIAQDRGVWYSFRNSGGVDATIVGAVFAPLPWDDDDCTGSCRNRP